MKNGWDRMGAFLPYEQVCSSLWLFFAIFVQKTQNRFWLYTANILTAKSTGFTCVPFSPVVPLSFWQSMNVGNGPLYFDCTSILTPISTTFRLPFWLILKRLFRAFLNLDTTTIYLHFWKLLEYSFRNF